MTLSETVDGRGREHSSYQRKPLTANPIKITDTTFRDAHQSLLATRLRTVDMEPVAAKMDSVGFHSIEVWGGATFDVATRFLAEDPWERLRVFKGLMPRTPLTMLLRGQTLVGYRNYADDVVDAFVEAAAGAGIDIFRVFDALNDQRNLARAAQAIKGNGKHLQLAICYSITEGGRLGGPIYSLDYFVEKAKVMQGMGADSICLKDMGGLMAPYDAYEIVAEFKSILDVPIQLHTHYTSGMASMTVLKAIEAGVDMVDACLAPLALRTSQPAVEPLIVALKGTDRDSGLELDGILGIADYLETILPKYSEHMDNSKSATIDARVLGHQIPGGMASNLVSQLREAGALDRLEEVLQEIPRTRKELGYPPLVTPMSQMVGTQAVSNVLLGRYKMVSDQVKDYAYGLYGHPAAPLDEDVVALALRDYERGSEPISQRPADLIEPEMDSAREAVKHISTDIEDVLTYALYPTTGLRFLRIKHGLDPVPDEMKPKAVEDLEAPVPRGVQQAPPKSARVRSFNVYVGDEFFEVSVDPLTSRPAGPRDSDTVGVEAARAQATAEPKASPTAGADEVAIRAPIPGVVLKYLVEVGQSVQEGDPVVVLEAMKMENTLPSPASGKVKSLPWQSGETVAKDDVLATIAP